MRLLVLLLLTGALSAQAPVFHPVGTVDQIMIGITYPASNAIFYITRNPPKEEKEWTALQNQALMMAESGNLLMMASRARDQDDWIKDSEMLVSVGAAAFKAAQAKDMDALVALSDQLNTACVTCHQQYRPAYRRRR